MKWPRGFGRFDTIMISSSLSAVWKIPFILCISLSLLNIPGTAEGVEPFRVYAVKSREFAHFDAALQGFSRALRKKGVRISLTIFNMNGSKDEGIRIMKDMARAMPDLILTIGTSATELARDSYPGTPVIFCMVLNPVADGLAASMESSGRNLTGASLDIPSRTQFKAMKGILPSTRKIGVVYSPEKSASLIKEASITARELGCELIARPVSSESDVPRAMEELRLRNIDFLWSISDEIVFNSFTSIQFIILYSMQHRIPFMGLSPSFVKSGALVAFSCDPEENGRQAGERAALVLAGRKPSDIPIAVPVTTPLLYNSVVAKQLGIRISRPLTAHAEEILQ